MGEFQYSVRVAGAQLIKGDAQSVSVIFGNLDGTNFVNDSITHQTHAQWLDYMAHEFKVELKAGCKIEFMSPDGGQLRESVIGRSISP